MLIAITELELKMVFFLYSQTNQRMSLARLQHEVEELRRRIEELKAKLTAEMKVRFTLFFLCFVFLASFFVINRRIRLHCMYGVPCFKLTLTTNGSHLKCKLDQCLKKGGVGWGKGILFVTQ